MLHEGVGGNNEEAGNPGARKDGKGREPVHPRAQLLVTKKEEAQEGGFQEKGENPFHG